MDNFTFEALNSSLWLNASEFINASTNGTANDTDTEGAGPGSNWEDIVILVFKVIIMGSIILMAIMGNVLVIVSITMNRKLHGITNYFLVSLAIADMLVAVCVMTFNASVEFFGKWLFGYRMCDLWMSFDVYFSTVSILHLCCISIDRYYAILNPLEYPLKMTKRKVLVMLAFVWLGPTLISFLPIFLGWYATSDHLLDRTLEPDNCNFEVNNVFAILSSAISFWIPCTVMVILYYRIFQEARKQETAIMSRTNSMSAIHNIHRRLSPAVTIRKFLYNLKSGRTSKNIFKTKRNRNRNRQEFPMCPITIGCNNRQRERTQSIYSATSDVQISCGYQHDNSPCRCSYPDKRMPTPPCIIMECEPEPNDPTSPVSSIHGALMVRDKAGCSQMDDDCLKETSLNNGHSGKSRPSLVSGLMPSSTRTSTSHQLMIPNMDRGVPVMRREHKAARTLGIIMGAFIVCWLPFFIWYVTVTICGEACNSPKPVITTLFWIGYFNSTLNPFIYAYFRKDFREAFMKTLRRLHCCRKGDPNSSFV